MVFFFQHRHHRHLWQLKTVPAQVPNMCSSNECLGTPMSVGSLEEIIDDNHAIVSTSVGSEHYVSILSFVDKDQLEPGPYFKMTCEVPLADWKELARLEIILTSHFEWAIGSYFYKMTWKIFQQVNFKFIIHELGKYVSYNKDHNGLNYVVQHRAVAL